MKSPFYDYPNNDFIAYGRKLYRDSKLGRSPYTLVQILQILPRLIWRVLHDAGIEIVLLLMFYAVLTFMSQGRDLIVSMFEPNGIYGYKRILITTLSVLSYSVSMWLIPAFLFQLRENLAKKNRGERPIREHLFFIHRVLPLVPFWLLAASLFNKYGAFAAWLGKWWAFPLASLLELLLLYLIFRSFKEYRRRRIVLIGIGGILALCIGWFIYRFQSVYTEAKIMYAVILYLIPLALFMLYYQADENILMQHSQWQKARRPGILSHYRFNSSLYIGCGIAHVILLIFLGYAKGFEIAPESFLLYIFSVYVFAIDLVVYLINLTPRVRLFSGLLAATVCALLLSGVLRFNTTHHDLAAMERPGILNDRARSSFDDRYAILRQQILDDSNGAPYPIILVSGEGGGSRAGLWFSSMLINMDLKSGYTLRKHIFSLSTVSGSSVGLSTFLSYLDQTRDAEMIDTGWALLPEKVFSRNYVGSSVRSVLLTDMARSVWPWNAPGTDRNAVLQREEAAATAEGIRDLFAGKHAQLPPDSSWNLNRDFMSYFYENRDGHIQLRTDMPLAMINTCRSNDGRRGVISPIRLSPAYFNDAVDVAGYLYDKAIVTDDGTRVTDSRKKNITLGQACNMSELFPVFSAPVYIDSLGNFVDGGYHDNSGLKTTLDVYLQLKRKLGDDTLLATKNKTWKIYILYLKNGGSLDKNLYKSNPSGLSIAQPLLALSKQPFQGSASYFEEKAKLVDLTDPNAVFVVGDLKHQQVINRDSSREVDPRRKEVGVRNLEREMLRDLIGETVQNTETRKWDTVLNIPLARWLSKSISDRIRTRALWPNMNKQTIALVNTVRVRHGKAEVYPFAPVQQGLK